MKLIDFSKTDNNQLLSCLGGNIKLINTRARARQPEITFQDRGDVKSVSYSYNGQHVIYVNENKSKLNIITYNALTNSDLNSVFTFLSDIIIIDFIVSPIHNHVAIIFIAQSNITISTDGQHRINPENSNKMGLHIYDFTPGNSRLLFERYEDDLRNMSFSEDNKFAISGGFNVTGQHCGLIIVDLATGNIISHGLEISAIEIIYLYPNLTHPRRSSNRILVISINDDDIRNIEIRDTNTLELIHARQTNLFIFDVYVKSSGEIILATDNGIYCFTMTFIDREVVPIFREYYISEITYSINRDRIGLLTLGPDPENINSSKPDNIFIYDFAPRINIMYQSNPNPGQYRWRHQVQEEPFIRMIPDAPVVNPPTGVVSSEPEIYDTQLDIAVATPPSNAVKLKKYGKKQCFDIFNTSEEIIGNYLTSNTDNLVIFYKYSGDDDFQASCLTFSALKTYLKDPNYVFYRCIDRKDYRTYQAEPPEFLKLPTQSGNLFVDYQLMKQKYMQRQNMVFLEHGEQIPKTITLIASLSMHFVSRNHCQEGSVIDVYRIIF